MVEVHREIVETCNLEMKGRVEDRAVLKQEDKGESLIENLGLLSKEEFYRLANAKVKPREEVMKRVKEDFVDKRIHEIIKIQEWAKREGEMRGVGWRMVPAVVELPKGERVCVAQMAKDGEKISVLEGNVVGVEADGSMTVDVGGTMVEVDRKGAATKVFWLRPEETKV